MSGLIIAKMKKRLRAYHRRRLGPDEWFDRSLHDFVIERSWHQRHAIMDAPPAGWFVLRLCLIYWRLTFHPNLVVYGKLFNEGTTRLAGLENRAAKWEAQRRGRERQRAHWQDLAALFRAWEKREQEKRRRKEEDSRKKRRRQEQWQSASGTADPYALALDVLGLSEPFDKAMLKRAWKAAIFKAHPDRGGSTAQAQAINAAKDFILRRRGW